MKMPTLDITIDNTQEFMKLVDSFKKDAVLVGIPMENVERQPGAEEKAGPIGNAQLLAMMTFGSPANNIPARPALAIGIRNAQEQIAEQYKKAAQKALKGGVSALTTHYERVGIIAVNSVKKAINSNEGIDPPSAATLAARKAKGFSGTKALVVTGQMRNAITYVVKSIWGK